MKKSSKSSAIEASPQPALRQLLRCWWLGVALGSAALLGALAFGTTDYRTWPQRPADAAALSCCKEQIKFRVESLQQIEKELMWHKLRVTFLEHAISHGKHRNSLLLSERAEEIAASEHLIRRQRGLNASSGDPAHGPVKGFLLLLLVSLFDLVLGWWLLGPSIMFVRRRLESTHLRVGLVLALVLFGIQALCEVRSSIFAPSKMLFGWDSFCVSIAGWSANRVFVLGLCLCSVFPLSIAYALGDPVHSRQRFRLRRVHCGLGVRNYISAAKRAIFLGLLIVIGGIFLGLKLTVAEARSPEPIYLVMPATLLLVALFLAWRIVSNVTSIHHRHSDLSWRLKLLEKSDVLGPDPTAGFWEKPAKLPGAIVVSLTLVLALLKYLGVLPEGTSEILSTLVG